LIAKKRQERELGIKDDDTLSPNATIEEIGLAAMKGISKLLSDDIPNSRLEREMGVNNQPVSLQEIDSLMGMLSSPELKPTHI